MSQLFSFKDYKDYLSSVLSTKGNQRGHRSKLASFLGCQVSFLSQVLNGNTHLSLEHGLRTSEYLGHAKDESHFFMLLLELGRAGSLSLKNYFQDQINGVLARRGEISQSVRRTDSLNAESQAKYYSAWYYAAIHIIISIPEFQTVHAISERLKLPQKIVGAALEFLDSVGLAILQEGKFCIGPKRIHLSPDSDLIIQHHTNWRLQSIYGLERRSGSDIHYSSVYSIAKSDLAKIRGILIRAVEQFEPMIMDSKEEEIICINFDLMTL